MLKKKESSFDSYVNLPETRGYQNPTIQHIIAIWCYNAIYSLYSYWIWLVFTKTGNSSHVVALLNVAWADFLPWRVEDEEGGPNQGDGGENWDDLFPTHSIRDGHEPQTTCCGFCSERDDKGVNGNIKDILPWSILMGQNTSRIWMGKK